MMESTEGQQPETPSEGMTPREAASQIEGLLDADGHFNPNPEQLSREHPDYDPDTDPRAGGQARDERGRFAAEDSEEDDDITVDDDEGMVEDAEGDVSTEDTEEGDTDEELAASADEDADTDDEETGDLKTLSDFATALDMSVEDLSEGLTHTFNAAGEEVTVTLNELVAGYQKDADYRRSTAKLSEDRQAFDQHRTEQNQQFEQLNHVVAGQIGLLEQMVGAELNDPRLAALRESDPAEWTARRDEIGQRLGFLRQKREEMANLYRTHVDTNLTQLREREMAALAEKVPDFGDTQRSTARDVMKSIGMTDQEISQVFDHRLVMAALELNDLRSEVEQLRSEKAAGTKAAKRVKKAVPKLQKPGKRQAKSAAGLKRDNVAKLSARARKSGKVEDAAKVIEQMI